jgi:hypothetical protein
MGGIDFMSIKVNTYQLQSKSTYAASIASQLREKVDQVNNIYYSLDSKVKSRQGIGSSIRSLQNRIENAQRKMYNISRFLTTAASSYNTAEAVVAARGASLGSVASASASAAAGAINVGANTGTAQGKVEEKKWYQSNWFKLTVGAVVVGAAIAAAVVATAVASPVIAAIAVGAAIGAGIGAVVGGVTGGVVSKMNGGSFVDGLADGFMWGAIGGAISGAISATGVGIIGAAAAEGAVNAGMYVGQTMQNGGDVTVAGVATSFVIGAGFSAIGTVISSKISGAISKNVSGNIDNTAKSVVDSVDETGGTAKTLNTFGDALRDKLGPAKVSHPDELNAILNHADEAKVGVEFRSGTLAYEPSLSSGKPGRLILDPDASIGAVRHEYRHMLDDMAQGHPGFSLIADSDAFWKLEYRGYMEEIRLARQTRNFAAGRFILDEMRARRMEILGR